MLKFYSKHFGWSFQRIHLAVSLTLRESINNSISHQFWKPPCGCILHFWREEWKTCERRSERASDDRGYKVVCTSGKTKKKSEISTLLPYGTVLLLMNWQCFDEWRLLKWRVQVPITIFRALIETHKPIISCSHKLGLSYDVISKIWYLFRIAPTHCKTAVLKWGFSPKSSTYDTLFDRNCCLLLGRTGRAQTLFWVVSHQKPFNTIRWFGC